jgi:hypothetical protein
MAPKRLFSYAKEPLRCHVPLGGSTCSQNKDPHNSESSQKILQWYDGYNWLGPERVLNPYSILNFFSDCSLTAYWPLSEQPNHLSTLIRQWPEEFVRPELGGYLPYEIMTDKLGRPGATPILFHSGYLTIDRTKIITEKFEGELMRQESYSFKVPNYEVKSSYDRFCFQNVFGLNSLEVRRLGQQLIKAFEENDSETIAQIIGNLLSNVTSRQYISEEKFYHFLVQISFALADLEVIGKLVGAKGQTDFTISLPKGKRVIVEIKYRSVNSEDKSEDIDKYLDSALKEALKAIATKDYAGPFKLSAKSLDALAVAIYNRVNVKAAFASKETLIRQAKSSSRKSSPSRSPKSSKKTVTP